MTWLVALLIDGAILAFACKPGPRFRTIRPPLGVLIVGGIIIFPLGVAIARFIVPQ